MNRPFDTVLDAAATTHAASADLTPAPDRAIARSMQLGASNDATERPISAIDAIALCMRDSTFGG